MDDGTRALESVVLMRGQSEGFWRDRRVFVTGATGLVGGWVVRALVAHQADVVILVRDWVPHSHVINSDLIDSVTTVRGNLRDQLLLERILGEYEIATVLHLAAQTIVPIANRNPVSTFDSNIAGTWGLLEACRRSSSVSEIVVASSDKAYGEAVSLPYVETMPLNAVFPYDVSKACTDMIAACYANTWRLPVATTRCGNFFGGGDLNWNRIVPGTIRSVLRGQRPVIRSDGTTVRDYIYVEDAVSAYLCLAEKLAQNSALRGEAFNFSTESHLSTRAMVNRILELMDVDLEPIILNEANNEIQAQYLDASKAQRMLGWDAEFGLDDGLKSTIAWYREHLAKEAG